MRQLAGVFPATLAPPGQVFQPVETPDTRVVHDPALALQQDMEPRTAEAPVDPGQLLQPRPQGRVTIRAGHVLQQRSTDTQPAAASAFTQSEFLPDQARGLTFGHGRYHFL